MADYWDQYQVYLTPERALSQDGMQLFGRTAAAPSTTAPASLPVIGANGQTTTVNPLGGFARIGAYQGVQGAPQTQPGTSTDAGDPLAFIKEWQGSHPATRDSFLQLANELKTRFGIDRAPGAVGPSNNEFTINGEKVKVMGAEDSANPTWFAYGSDDGWRPGGDAAGMGLPAGYSLDGGPLSSFSAPGLVAPWTREYAAPTADDVINSAAVQSGLKLGQQAIERSAAAKGTLLTGGTLKDLTEFGLDLGNQQYGAEDARRFRNYTTDRDSFWGNQTNAYSKLSGFAGMGQNAINQTGQFGSQYADNAQLGATRLGDLYTGQANADAAARFAGQNATNTAASGIANAAGQIDWSSLFRRGTRQSPGLTNPVGYDENL